MKLWIIIIVLVVILSGGGVFFGMRIVDLSSRINELNLNYTVLQGSYNDLQSGYDTLDADYRTTLGNYDLLNTNYNALESDLNLLTGEFKSLEADHDTLEADYKNLESEYNSLESKYDKLSGEVSALKTENSKLEREKGDLQDLLNEYEKVPHAYYSTNIYKTYSNTFSDLGQFLISEFELPSNYELEVFDCSETAAYVEWALENAGFNAEIVVGPTPWDPASGYHAWVIAYTTDYKVAIEATNFKKNRSAYLSWGRIPGVVYSNDTLIEGAEAYYNSYDDSFKNIFEAIREHGTSSQQWNWWVGTFGFE